MATTPGTHLNIKMLLLTLLMMADGLFASKYVTEITKGTAEKFLKDKLFVITYVDSTGCSRCRNLYPYFAAASGSFPNDDDIFFTRTYDKQLTHEWGIQELPALVYHKKGADDNDLLGSRGVMAVDITVDDILDGIEKILHGDFHHIKKKYSVALNSDSFDAIVTTPRQSVMVLIYDEETEAETMPVIEKAAYAFRKDDAILFATLNVDKYSQLRDSRFKTRDIPSAMWFDEKDKKNAKRFGGMLAKELVVSFINEKTGLNRMSSGALMKEAGRIPVVDELLEEHADIIYNADANSLSLLTHAVDEIKSDLHNHHSEMLDYYLLILDKISEAGSATMVLDDLLLNIEATLYGDEEVSTKTIELLRRQVYVIHYFQEVVKYFENGQWQEALTNKDVVDSSVTLEHSHHVHTEL